MSPIVESRSGGCRWASRRAGRGPPGAHTRGRTRAGAGWPSLRPSAAASPRAGPGWPWPPRACRSSSPTIACGGWRGSARPNWAGAARATSVRPGRCSRWSGGAAGASAASGDRRRAGSRRGRAESGRSPRSRREWRRRSSNSQCRKPPSRNIGKRPQISKAKRERAMAATAVARFHEVSRSTQSPAARVATYRAGVLLARCTREERWPRPRRVPRKARAQATQSRKAEPSGRLVVVEEHAHVDLGRQEPHRGPASVRRARRGSGVPGRRGGTPRRPRSPPARRAEPRRSGRSARGAPRGSPRSRRGRPACACP